MGAFSELCGIDRATMNAKQNSNQKRKVNRTENLFEVKIDVLLNIIQNEIVIIDKDKIGKLHIQPTNIALSYTKCYRNQITWITNLKMY